MSDSINLLNNAKTLDTSPLVNGYTKVIINAGTDEGGNVIAYQAGTDGGAVLIVDNPFGTQQMAEDMLEKIRGWQYQPYSATGALLDPSAELGDGVTIAGTYGGLYTRNTAFTSLMQSDISAPGSEEIEHEQTSAVESATDRAYSRMVKAVNSRITQTATQIALEVQSRTAADENLSSLIQVNTNNITAKVSKQGSSGSGTTSFGWSLEDDRWSLFNNSGDILVATKDGLEVKGKITATSGTIGGYDIQSDYLSLYNMTWDSSLDNGIYIGRLGIRIGNKFYADTYGNVIVNNLQANNGTFAGDITCNSLRVKNAANVSGGGYDTIATNTISGGISGGNAYNGDFKFNANAGIYTYKNQSAILGSYGFVANGYLAGNYWLGNAYGGGQKARTLYFQNLTLLKSDYTTVNVNMVCCGG